MHLTLFRRGRMGCRVGRGDSDQSTRRTRDIIVRKKYVNCCANYALNMLLLNLCQARIHDSKTEVVAKFEVMHLPKWVGDILAVFQEDL
jgi:hypothetical protein